MVQTGWVAWRRSILSVDEWAQVAAAVAGFAAVIVALYGRPLRRLLLRPRLDLSFGNPQGVPVEEEWGSDGAIRDVSLRYFHLRVSNPRRWFVVTKVKVILLAIERRHSEADGYSQIWSGETPLPWRYPDENPPERDFGPGYDCDLCAVDSEGGLTFFQGIKWGLPADLRSQRGEIDLRLTLQAQGLEADSPRLGLSLRWDGKWPPTAFEMRADPPSART